MLFTSESKGFILVGIDERSTGNCATCAHCNKKLPKHPVIVRSANTEATVGVDCILEHVNAFIWDKLERDLAARSDTPRDERVVYLTGLHTRNFKSKVKDLIKVNQARLAIENGDR